MPAAARTLFDKVWAAHEVVAETPDTPAVLYTICTSSMRSPRRRPSASSRVSACRFGVPISPSRPWIIRRRPAPIRCSAACRSRSMRRRKQVRQLERNAAEFGVELFDMRDARRGIVHVIKPGTRGNAARHDHRLRRQPYQHARRFRCARLRNRHQEVGHVFATHRCCSASRKPLRSTSRGGCVPASAPRI